MRVFCLFQIFRVRAAVGLTALALAAGLPVQGQSWVIHPAPRLELPVRPDGNSATFWAAGTFRVFTSTGEPLMISIAGNQFTEWQSERVEDMGLHHVPLWVEAVQRDRNLLLAWYHHEPGGVCPQGGLTAPKIGAAISRDYGLSLTDLGIILESGYPVDCSAKNGFLPAATEIFPPFPTGSGNSSISFSRIIPGPGNSRASASPGWRGRTGSRPWETSGNISRAAGMSLAWAGAARRSFRLASNGSAPTRTHSGDPRSITTRT